MHIQIYNSNNSEILIYGEISENINHYHIITHNINPHKFINIQLNDFNQLKKLCIANNINVNSQSDIINIFNDHNLYPISTFMNNQSISIYSHGLYVDIRENDNKLLLIVFDNEQRNHMIHPILDNYEFNGGDEFINSNITSINKKDNIYLATMEFQTFDNRIGKIIFNVNENILKNLDIFSYHPRNIKDVIQKGGKIITITIN